MVRRAERRAPPRTTLTQRFGLGFALADADDAAEADAEGGAIADVLGAPDLWRVGAPNPSTLTCGVRGSLGVGAGSGPVSSTQTMRAAPALPTSTLAATIHPLAPEDCLRCVLSCCSGRRGCIQSAGSTACIEGCTLGHGACGCGASAWDACSGAGDGGGCAATWAGTGSTFASSGSVSPCWMFAGGKYGGA